MRLKAPGVEVFIFQNIGVSFIEDWVLNPMSYWAVLEPQKNILKCESLCTLIKIVSYILYQVEKVDKSSIKKKSTEVLWLDKEYCPICWPPCLTLINLPAGEQPASWPGSWLGMTVAVAHLKQNTMNIKQKTMNNKTKDHKTKNNEYLCFKFWYFVYHGILH